MSRWSTILGGPVMRRAAAMVFVSVVVVGGLAGYAIVNGEYSEALDAYVLRDQWLTIGLSRTSAPTGSVIHLDLADPPSDALLEFFAAGYRAYSPAFAAVGGLEAIVPPAFEGGSLVSRDVRVRLLSRSGPLWGASDSVPFTVAAPPVPRAPAGAASLFATEVARTLLAKAVQTGTAAVAAGAAASTGTHASALAERVADMDLLSAPLEALVDGSGERLVVGDLVVERSDLALMDQLAAAYLVGLGPASPSPCGEQKDAEVQELFASDPYGTTRFAGASLAASVKAAAARFAQSLIACDPQQLGEVARRTAASAGTTALEVLRFYRDTPKLAGLLILTVISTVDESVNATHLWKQWAAGADLENWVREERVRLSLGEGRDVHVVYEVPIGAGASRRVKKRLSDELRDAAEHNAYLSRVIEGLRAERELDEYVAEDLEKLFADEPARAEVARVVQEQVARTETREPTPTPTATPTAATTSTPTPTPTPTAKPTVAPTPVPRAVSTLTPARDLTGTWRGGINTVSADKKCQWSGPLVMDLRQRGDTLAGTGSASFSKAIDLVRGTGCAPVPDPIALVFVGTVSSSRVEINAGLGTDLTGSVTTDLMSGTLTWSGGFQGCFQATRVGAGGLPDCANPFAQAGPVATAAPTVAATAAATAAPTPTPAVAVFAPSGSVTSTSCTLVRTVPDQGYGVTHYYSAAVSGTARGMIGTSFEVGGVRPVCAAWTGCRRTASEPETTSWTWTTSATVQAGWAYSGLSTGELNLWSPGASPSRFYLVDHDTKVCQ